MIFRYQTGRPSLTSFLGGLIVLAVILVVMFYLFRWFYWLAALAMPVLIIATLLINYRVVTGFGVTLWKMLRHNPVVGIAAVLFSVLLLPLVVVYLFVKALLIRKVNIARKQAEIRTHGEWIDYEEVTESGHRKQKVIHKKDLGYPEMTIRIPEKTDRMRNTGS